MIDEMQALEHSGTWELVSLPPGKKVVGRCLVMLGRGCILFVWINVNMLGH